jgi:hypothetical protein
LQAHLPAGPVLDVEELERRVRRHCRRRRDDSTTLAPELSAGHVKLNAVAPVESPTGSTRVSARQRAQTGPVILPVFAATRSWPTNLGGACLDRILWTELPPGFVPEGATARLPSSWQPRHRALRHSQACLVTRRAIWTRSLRPPARSRWGSTSTCVFIATPRPRASAPMVPTDRIAGYYHTRSAAPAILTARSGAIARLKRGDFP